MLWTLVFFFFQRPPPPRAEGLPNEDIGGQSFGLTILLNDSIADDQSKNNPKWVQNEIQKDKLNNSKVIQGLVVKQPLINSKSN